MIAIGMVLALADTLLIRPGAMVDVERGELRRGLVAVVAGDRIVRVDSAGAVRPGPGWRVVDLPNATLLPGLIDTHVHLALAGDPEENLRRTLAAGFTAVRDLGTGAPPAMSEPAASVTAAYDWVGATGGTCDFQGQGVRGAGEFAARTRALIAQGAAVIKVCLTSWWAPAVSFPDSVELTREELDSVVAAAHGARRPVIAHAIGPAGVQLAIDGGVDGLAHLPRVTAELARGIAARGMTVSPTAATLLAGARGQPWQDQLAASAEAVRAAGIAIVYGTDAGVLPHGMNAREAMAMQRLGWSPAEILRSATTTAARTLGIAAPAGTIAAGARADLVAVEGNPLEDVAALGSVVLVVRAGRVVE
ncbi:MAG: amidohydrolase family protein [Gemmatimonadales bacterium]